MIYPNAEQCEAEAERAVARGDALLAAIWRARAACIRNGKLVKTRRTRTGQLALPMEYQG